MEKSLARKNHYHIEPANTVQPYTIINKHANMSCI